VRLSRTARGSILALACAGALAAAPTALAHGPAAPAGDGRTLVLHAHGLDGVSVRDTTVAAPDPGLAGTRLVRTLAAGPATIRVAVVLLSFADDPSQPVTVEAVDGVVFSSPGSVAALFAEQSGGRASVSGSVFGWFPTALPSTACDFQGWASAARDAIGAETLAGFTNLVVVVPRTTACDWAGLAYVGGPVVWINGAPTVGALAHELGHNLGLAHAKTLSCETNGIRVALAPACAVASEYGDPFTPMGTGTPVHVNGVHKAQLGWLAPEEILTVPGPGTYQLAPLAAPAGSGARALRIPRGDEWLYLEYRSATGPFEGLLAGTGVAGGVTVRLARETAGEDWDTRLLDATPETGTFTDAALAVGRVLADPVTGIRLATLAVSPAGATVAFEVGQAGDVTPPTPPTLTRAEAGTGGKVTLAWSASTDDVGVARYEVMRDGAVVASTTELAFTGAARARPARYAVRAIDASGNVGALSEARMVRQRPALHAPGRLAALARVRAGRAVVRLSWRRAGPRPAVRYLVLRGSVVVGATRSTSFVDTVPVARVSAVYRVVAQTEAGDRARSEPLSLELRDLAARPVRVAAAR
jgi:hypothetical protein